MTFKNNLQTIRKFNHLSQEKLAAKVGVSRQSISKWETGEAYPTMANVVALCSVLHCKVTDLIDTNSKEQGNFAPEAKQEIINLEQKDRKRLQKIAKFIYVAAKIARFISLLGFALIGISIYASRYIILNFLFSSVPEEITPDGLDFISFFQFGILPKLLLVVIIFAMYIFATLFIYLTLRETEHFFKRISNQKSPFSLENILSLKNISKYLILWLLSSTIPKFLFLIIDPSYKASINLPTIFFVLITICFVYIFRYGNLLESPKK